MQHLRVECSLIIMIRSLILSWAFWFGTQLHSYYRTYHNYRIIWVRLFECFISFFSFFCLKFVLFCIQKAVYQTISLQFLKQFLYTKAYNTYDASQYKFSPNK